MSTTGKEEGVSERERDRENRRVVQGGGFTKSLGSQIAL